SVHPPGGSRESRAIVHCQGTSVGARDRPVSGIVFSRDAAPRLENKAKKALSLNKGLPNYDQMSVWVLGLRRRRTETPRFLLIPSGGGPCQARLCQKTSVTLLNIPMDLTLQTQLLPDADQARRLKETVERFNQAANWLAGEAFTCKVANKFVLQRLFYKELRDRFGLPADMAIRCIAEVVNVYKRDKSRRPKFRKHAAIPYSMGNNLSFKGPDRVSIGGLQGRIIVPFLMGKYQQEKFAQSKGQCDLVLRHDGRWFLLVTVDLPEGTQTPVTDFLGVDLGVVNIAFDSDGRGYSSEPIETKRRQYAARRRSLGTATQGADRNRRRRCHKALARTKAKEAQFRRDINHQISKRLVASAKGTGRGIALEDLDGIR